MKSFARLFICVIVMGNTTSVIAEVYKTNPHVAYHYDYSPYEDISNIYGGVTPYGIAAKSGPIVYDANLDASNNGSVSMAPVVFQVNGNDYGSASYPYSTKSFNRVKFNISSNGTVAVNHGLTTFTATFYEGIYSFSTFDSRTTGQSTGRTINFSATPVSLLVSAFIADDNNDWGDRIRPDNNDDFLRTTPYHGLAGALGENNNDTEGAGIEFFNLQGSLTMLVREYDNGGHLISSANEEFANPFNLRTYAVVPELHSLWMMSATIGGIVIIAIPRKWQRHTCSPFNF